MRSSGSRGFLPYSILCEDPQKLGGCKDHKPSRDRGKCNRCDPVPKENILLLGDTKRSDALCEKLQYYQITEGTIWIGKNLSYPEETIEKKSLKDLEKEDLQGLCVALIERKHPLVRRTGSIADEEFIRGKVPMTKSEVRSLCLAKLNLPEDGILYDIGAGTGSVSVEAAVKGRKP